MFNLKMKIGTRIVAMVAGMLSALVVVGGVAVYIMQEIGNELHDIAKEDIPLSRHVTEVALNQLEQAVVFERALRLGENPAEAKHLAELISRFRRTGEKVNKEFKEAEHIAQEATKEASSAAARAKFGVFLKELEALDHAHAVYERHALELMTLLANGELKRGGALATKVEAEEEVIDHKVKALVRQIEAFTKEATDKASAHETTGLLVILVLTAIAFLISILQAFVIIRGITRPLRTAVEALDGLAQGDTSIEVVGTERGDEVGDVARGLEVFKQGLIERAELQKEQEAAQSEQQQRAKAVEDLCSNFETSIGEVVGTVSSSATQMQSTASSMSTTADSASQQAAAVAAASEQATVNVQTVASAAEQMSNSVSEISRQVTRSTEIASRAVGEADKTNATVEGLSEAATKVGDVVQLISEIAEKTNLLALNATIESAPAGDAGKGFAVVANEVKSLAEQTGKATDEIGEQITAIQNETGNAVEAIKGIGTIIEEISGITTSIASAVEEQSAATQEIARNCQEAAKGTGEVSGTITQVNQAASDTGSAATQVLQSAESLASQSDRMRVEVEEFLTNVKAA